MSIADAPPSGGATARPLRDALAAALGREVDDGTGREASIPELIARKLTAKALDGDLGTIREIFDRIDGRPVAVADADDAATGDLATERSGASSVLAEYPPPPPASDTTLRIEREHGAACDLVSAMSACANADMWRVAAGA